MSPLLSHLSTTVPILLNLTTSLYWIATHRCNACGDRGVMRAVRPGTGVGPVVECPGCGRMQLPELRNEKKQ